jgi:hypothetical protein
VSPAPDYVEYGPRVTFPPAFLAKGGEFRGFLLKGESARIKSLCDRVLNVPAEEKIKYEPLGPYVVMMVGSFAEQTSRAKDFLNRGYAAETALVFWVPLLATDPDGGTRLCLAAPYVFVDNEMSLLCGREDFGYAKTLANFHPKTGSGEKVKVEAFGGDFEPGSKAEWYEVLNIAETAAPLPVPPLPVPVVWDTPKNVATALLLAAGATKATAAQVLKLVQELIEEKARHVFLKQFRDAELAGKACYRYVVEAPLAFTELSVRVLFGEWHVDVTSLKSHPVTDDLGVAEQSTNLAFELKMNMLLSAGKEVAP